MKFEDHPLGPQALRLHDAAVVRGDSGYIDPLSGAMVLTARYLMERSFCCGAGCRHCPYPTDVRTAAGRPDDAPCWHEKLTN